MRRKCFRISQIVKEFRIFSSFAIERVLAKGAQIVESEIILFLNAI